ncbi:Hsp20/alpha crystallin family protein [Paenibacillus donghaensis]|uniref:SHSP domain-containing protein n=1 Tax=Paenibacillus donghaensis TaxID=414771 RepID=A0A2Z2KHV6_9BACL|nr:Hsp20/alpha crystallin family protein [Paenibacillus donghaensis]ASA21779.1 hypothetical protein B9T62_13970 [Paenibacillus donghaensis]
MSSGKGNPLDWLRNDPFFANQISLKALEEQWKLDPDAIDSYVDKVIREATPSLSPTSKTKLKFEHVDTHSFLITKIRIPSSIHPENLWLQLYRTQLKIGGLANDRSEVITLPVPVNPNQSRATFKQGTLQLKMPKLSAGRYKDIPVRFL